MLKAKPASELKSVAVVDVRDDDFAVCLYIPWLRQSWPADTVDQGGNIVAAVNVPSSTFHDNVAGLVKRLEQCQSTWCTFCSILTILVHQIRASSFVSRYPFQVGAR